MESKNQEDREWARMRIRELAAEKSARAEERGYESASSESSVLERYNGMEDMFSYSKPGAQEGG
jgi:hypothetical protein